MAIVFIPPLHMTLPLGGPRRKIAITFDIENLNDVATRRWKKFGDMFSRFDAIPACDGQTDGQTSCGGIGIVHAMHNIAR